MRKFFLYFLYALFIAALVFTRFYNLPATSRFTRDESSNLVDMHRIFVDRQLTLVGPIDVVNYVIYPSLTFYMLLPFAIIGNFATYSPAWGTAFYGVLTALLMIYLVGKINKKFVVISSLLFLVWFPLVESSRWAWNPHLVPFVSSIALILWLGKSRFGKFLSGIFFGLAFHLHYFTFVSTAAFLGLSFKKATLCAFGFIVTIIPFVIFDLRNPPGIFFGRFLHNNLVISNFSDKVTNFGETIIANIYNAGHFLVQSQALAAFLLVAITALVIIDIRSKNKGLTYFFPFFAQVAAISFLPSFAGRYVLLAITFFTIWLIYPREKWGTIISLAVMGIMIIGGLLSINRLLTQPQIQPGAFVVEEGSKIIASQVTSEDLKNVNVAVIGSPDPDPIGTIYRHTLLVKEVRMLTGLEYDITDNLFVISTSSEEAVRSDAASILNKFRKGKLVRREEIKATNWVIYLFNRGNEDII